MFCYGCGKEIHETAPSCPHCGALQKMPLAVNSQRSVAKLIGLSVVWTIVFWIAGLILAGMIAGSLNPENAERAGEQAGNALSGIFLIISLCLLVGFTIVGKLPGTKKNLSKRDAFTQINQKPQTAHPLSQQSSASAIEQLEKLASMKEKGIITEAEFLAKKKSLLGV